MKYALRNGIILNGNQDMEPVYHKIILVNDGKIEKIVDEKYDTTGYEVVNLEAKYIMPGLINLHLHLPGSGKPKKKETDIKKLIKVLTGNPIGRTVLKKMLVGYAQTELYSGVTTIRCVGGITDTESRLRDEINAGKLIGPRILTSNMAVSVPGGHMAGSLAYEAHSAEEAANFVRIIAKDKPDLIKLMITGGVLDAKVKGEPGVLKMQPELVKAACDTAHELGLMVAAHVESPEGVRVALENGVDTIEHGAKPDEEIIRLFKERKAAMINTISPALPYALFDRSISHASELAQYNGNIVFEGCIANAKACIENGIPVGLGTDTGCPFITHYDMWRELNYFVKYIGVDNRFALYTATKVNAQIARIDNITGTIEEGKSADMIVTRLNPLEDITTLRNVDLVVAQGKVIKHPKLKKYENVEVELDKFL